MNRQGRRRVTVGCCLYLFSKIPDRRRSSEKVLPPSLVTSFREKSALGPNGEPEPGNPMRVDIYLGWKGPRQQRVQQPPPPTTPPQTAFLRMAGNTRPAWCWRRRWCQRAIRAEQSEEEDHAIFFFFFVLERERRERKAKLGWQHAVNVVVLLALSRYMYTVCVCTCISWRNTRRSRGWLLLMLIVGGWDNDIGILFLFPLLQNTSMRDYNLYIVRNITYVGKKSLN